MDNSFKIQINFPYSETNQYWDGRGHDVGPTRLQCINNSQYYCMYGHDFSKNVDMFTLLKKDGAEFFKVPLDDYDAFKTLLSISNLTDVPLDALRNCQHIWSLSVMKTAALSEELSSIKSDTVVPDARKDNDLDTKTEIENLKIQIANISKNIDNLSKENTFSKDTEVTEKSEREVRKFKIKEIQRKILSDKAELRAWSILFGSSYLLAAGMVLAEKFGYMNLSDLAQQTNGLSLAEQIASIPSTPAPVWAFSIASVGVFSSIAAGVMKKLAVYRAEKKLKPLVEMEKHDIENDIMNELEVGGDIIDVKAR